MTDVRDDVATLTREEIFSHLTADWGLYPDLPKYDRQEGDEGSYDPRRTDDLIYYEAGDYRYETQILKGSRSRSHTGISYLPKNGIRLLQLKAPEPRELENEVYCTMIVSDIPEKGRVGNFAALSYVWGHSSDQGTMVCNGQRVQIRRSLFEVLRRLRARLQMSEELLLWVDALCIDQRNRLEKEAQVGIMHEIYGAASEVIVWL
jgi:hypothetical protein